MLSFLLFVVFVISMILLIVRAFKKDLDLVGIIYFALAMASGVWWSMRVWTGHLLF